MLRQQERRIAGSRLQIRKHYQVLDVIPAKPVLFGVGHLPPESFAKPQDRLPCPIP